MTAGLTLWLAPQLAAAEDVTVYENDFETPNQAVTATCGNSLDQAGINETYGKPGYRFLEKNTVETVVLHDPASKYRGQGSHNGDYAIGMLGSKQDDKLAFRFDVQGQEYLNVAMDVSSIDVDGCGGPFGVATPQFKVSLLDDTGGDFDWNAEILDEKTLGGDAAPDAWTFRWARGTVALDASQATTGEVIVVFDLMSSGYAAFDNLKITASQLAAVGDRDDDGVADEKDNCPGDANSSQANVDADSAGDACDPQPKNPRVCGDKQGDGVDDCKKFCDLHAAPSCSDKPVTDEDGGATNPDDRADASDDDDKPSSHKPGRTGGGSSSSGSSTSKSGGGCSAGVIQSKSPDLVATLLFGLVAIQLRRVRRRRS